jgi:hypothetical protein
MKYYIVAGCVAVAALAVAINFYHSKPEDAHTHWKRYTVEAETKVRPAYFEDMKFKPGPEVRQPASNK